MTEPKQAPKGLIDVVDTEKANENPTAPKIDGGSKQSEKQAPQIVDDKMEGVESSEPTRKDKPTKMLTEEGMQKEDKLQMEKWCKEEGCLELWEKIKKRSAASINAYTKEDLKEFYPQDESQGVAFWNWLHPEKTQPEAPAQGPLGLTGPMGAFGSPYDSQTRSLGATGPFGGIILSSSEFWWHEWARPLSARIKHEFLFPRCSNFGQWAASFIDAVQAYGAKYLVLDEVQRCLRFMDTFVCFFSGLSAAAKSVYLVILGTPAPGLLKLDLGANIVSRSAHLTIPTLNVVEVYSLLRSKISVDSSMLIDCWTLLDGNPAAYQHFLENGIPPDFQKRQALFLVHLQTTGLASDLPDADILGIIAKTGTPVDYWKMDLSQQQRVQKLVEREVIVRKAPFAQYAKSSNAKKTFVGFTKHHYSTAAAAFGNFELQKDSTRFGHFMANQRGLALEDAFKSLFHWLITNQADSLTPGLAPALGKSLKGWTLLESVAFAGINTDADMVLESFGISPSEFVFFYIKSEERMLFEEEGIRNFLSAFNQLSELHGRTVYLVLGCQETSLKPPEVESGLQLWKTKCSEFPKVKFCPPIQVVGFFNLIQGVTEKVVGNLVCRPRLAERLEAIMGVNKVVVLQGARQVGKTTFIQEFVKEERSIVLQL